MNLASRTMVFLQSVRHEGLQRWMAKLAAKRGVSLGLITAILVIDLVIPWSGPGYLPRWQGLTFVPRAFVDEPCAVATALVTLGAITRFRGAPPDPKFGWSLLAWSVLIDIDYLPQEFGNSILTKGTPRPYTHALWVLVVLIAATLVVSCWGQRAKTPASAATVQIVSGAAWGIGVHFIRDLATAPMSLWWPVTNRPVQQPYWCYAMELLIIAAMSPVHIRKRMPREHFSEPTVTLSDERA